METILVESSEKLKPCYNCKGYRKIYGEKYPVEIVYCDHFKKTKARCGCCGVSGPNSPDNRKAISNWNRIVKIFEEKK